MGYALDAHAPETLQDARWWAMHYEDVWAAELPARIP
jgi:hypothetical protein